MFSVLPTNPTHALMEHCLRFPGDDNWSAVFSLQQFCDRRFLVEQCSGLRVGCPRYQIVT